MATFGWCLEDRHQLCIREFEQFYTDKGKLIKTGVVIKCQCSKRGCKCFVKKADRKKKK